MVTVVPVFLLPFLFIV